MRNILKISRFLDAFTEKITFVTPVCCIKSPMQKGKFDVKKKNLIPRSKFE